MGEHYPYIQEQKLTSRKLLNCSFRSIPVSQITNGLIVELIRFTKINRLQLKTVLSWLRKLYGKNWPKIPPADLTVIKALTTLFKKHRRLTVQRKENERMDFMNAQYVLPISQAAIAREGREMKPKAGVMKSKLRRSLLRREERAIHKRSMKDMTNDLSSAIKKLNFMQKRVDFLDSEIKKLRQKERRKINKLQARKELISQLESEKKKLSRDLTKQLDKLQKTKKKAEVTRANHKKRIALSKSRFKSKIQRLKSKKIHGLNDCEDDVSPGSSVATDSEAVHKLEVEIDELKEKMEELQPQRLKVMEKGHFNHEIRECCMTMLAHNVGIQNVESCIRAALQLAKVDVDRLPKKTALADMIVEARSISHFQLSEQIPQHMVNTLHSDGTTKFGEKFGGFQVSTPNSSYTLCLTEMKAGGARDFKEILENALADIDSVCKAVTSQTGAANKILVSLKNTMSDRHIVEKNFNDLLQSYRLEVLPEVVNGWESLTPDQQSTMCKMNNFFCGLHFLVALADSCSATLCQWESAHEEETSTQSGTLRLIRTACKAVQKQCSQKAGCHVMFRAYLEMQGIKIFPISKFEGNRFNIVFHNAGGLYFLHNRLRRYLQEVHHTQNKLLQSVLSDIKNPLYVQGCRALGIVSKCVTAPLWRILESNISMTGLSKEYQRLQSLLLEWSSDASPLLAGCGLSETREDDEVCSELLKKDDSDTVVTELLQLLCRSFHLAGERLLGDHLQGGVFDVSSSEASRLDDDTVTVPKTNARSERDFALLDRLLREKPNSSQIALESMILYKRNKTADWLKTKSDEEKKKIFEACIKVGRNQRMIYKQRKKELISYREETLKQREQCLARKCEKEREKKILICRQICKHGVWRTDQDVTSNLGKMTTENKRKEALKTQLRYRQCVLQQSFPDKSVFFFSKGGKQLSSAILAENLTKLTATTPGPSNEIEILYNPSLLVGMQIRHRFLDEDGNLEWYNGVVVGRINELEFEVVYSDEDEVYQFDLLADYREGDLKLVV